MNWDDVDDDNDEIVFNAPDIIRHQSTCIHCVGLKLGHYNLWIK